MFTEPDWQLVMQMTGSIGCVLEFEDLDRGLQMAVHSRKRGDPVVVYAFRGDEFRRCFPTEEAMIAAYEKSPGVLCATCGAIVAADSMAAADGGG